MVKFSNNLAVDSWNIDGVFQRIDNERLCKLSDSNIIHNIRKFDIIGLLETHCGPNDNLHLDNYYIFQVHRRKSPKAHRFSGGIAIAIKQDIRKGIKILPVTHTEFLWIKLDKNFFKFDSDIYLCFVYISPINSSFSGKNDDIFELLENDIANFSKTGYCLLFGDFNARTNIDCDHIEDNITDEMFKDISPFYNFEYEDSYVPRKNQDTHVTDTYGKKLLDLCKTCDLQIANGRILGDQLGYFTCYNHVGMPSVIDYCLLQSSLLDRVKTFHVHNVTPFSIHCVISLILRYKDVPNKTFSQNQTIDNSNSLCKYKWSDRHQLAYKLAISSQNSLHRIESLLKQKIVTNQDSINSDITELNDIILTAANLACVPQKESLKPPKQINKKNKCKKWFDSDCKLALKNVKTIANMMRKNPYNKQLLHEFFHKRKIYKRTLQSKKRQFTNKILNELENLHDKSPNKFWDLAKKLNYSSTNHTNISPNIQPKEWFNYFNNLMGKQTIITSQNQSFDQEITDYVALNKDKIFNELNFQITRIETKRAISKLKNNKAAGNDKILNEFIKTGQETLIPVITKLFNSIFSSGLYPENWNMNILSPIYKKGDRNNPENYRGISISSNLSKLFCSILNNRLINFLNKNSIIPLNQIGFRKGFRTSDHIMVLKTLIDKYIKKNKYLYVTFVDFKAAFDSIWRKALFYKLVKSGVGGLFINMLINIYSDVKYSVKHSTGITDGFNSYTGVKQGCVLSPILFNVFLSDLPYIYLIVPATPWNLLTPQLTV